MLEQLLSCIRPACSVKTVRRNPLRAHRSQARGSSNSHVRDSRSSDVRAAITVIDTAAAGQVDGVVRKWWQGSAAELRNVSAYVMKQVSVAKSKAFAARMSGPFLQQQQPLTSV